MRKGYVIVPIVCLALVAPIAINSKTHSANEKVASKIQDGKVLARVVNQDGELSSLVLTDKVILSDSEWKAKLTRKQFEILRESGTERAFTGAHLKNKEMGLYLCQGCNLPLFSSDNKFKSGTGWPSFYEPVGPSNILERRNLSQGMVRTEILCPRCESHLGHVFPDGPKPAGLRYCLNSASLNFVGKEDLSTMSEVKDESEVSEIVIAGGCFWCVEGVLEQVDGVLKVESGYTGGDAATANYKAVCSGRTGHAEAVRVTFDRKKVSLRRLLEIHFATHDPTTLNRQGADQGPQYRSAIFYANEEQKTIAQNVIAKLDAEEKFSKPIVTTLEHLDEFYEAEPNHQDYVSRNPNDPYVRAVAQPKVNKVRALLVDAIKDGTASASSE